MPEYIELCIESIKMRKGNLAFHLLDQRTIREFLPDLRPEWNFIERAAHKADYIRTRLVHRYGGIWIDCDMAAVGDLEKLFDFPETYDYACQNLTSSIGCFVARPGCELLRRMMIEQDRVLNDKGIDFKWHELGNGLLRKLGDAYPHHRWQEWSLDELAGSKISALFSRTTSIEEFVDANAILFHFCNEATGKEIELRIRRGRTFKSQFLLSKILRKALYSDTDIASRRSSSHLLEALKDTNFPAYGEKLMRKMSLRIGKRP